MISSSSSTAARLHVPCEIFSSSATWRLVFRPERDVVRDVVAADRQDGRPERRAVGEHREVDRPGADVGDRDAELLLGLGQDRVGRGEAGGDELVDLDAGRVDALREVLDRGRGAGDDVDLDLEAERAHPERVLDALLAVDLEAPPLDVEDDLVRRDRDGPGDLDRPVDVLAADLLARPADRDLAGRVQALDVLAADRHEGPVDLPAGQALGPLDGLGDRADRLVDVDDDALLQAGRGTVPWPMIVSRPSRLTSPIKRADLDVPTSIPTRTASLSTVGSSPLASWPVLRRSGAG